MFVGCEKDAKKLKTQKVREYDWDKLNLVASAIYQQYLKRDWVVRKNEGSITLQNPEDAHEVVTIFKDYGNRLTNEAGIRVHRDPVAVGIEICNQVKGVQDLLREKLEKLFGDYYLKGEYNILPNLDHNYDIVILPEGPCEGVNEELYVKLKEIPIGEEARISVLIGEKEIKE